MRKLFGLIIVLAVCGFYANAQNPFLPLWEHILSLVLLFVAAYGCVWISGKIYRTGILMYGKKPSIAELIRWIKYKA